MPLPEQRPRPTSGQTTQDADAGSSAGWVSSAMPPPRWKGFKLRGVGANGQHHLGRKSFMSQRRCPSDVLAVEVSRQRCKAVFSYDTRERSDQSWTVRQV